MARRDFDVDFVDLAELDLPLLTEPHLPRLRKYTQASTIAWSERVAAADVFIFVAPEYNHSFSPALGNALDHLRREWRRKAFSFVSYGGVSAGTRGAGALLPITTSLALVRTAATVEIPFIGSRITDGAFVATGNEEEALGRVLDELGLLPEALRPLR